MAIYKIKRFSHVKAGNIVDSNNFSDIVSKMSMKPEVNTNNFVGAVLGLGVIAAIIYAIGKFFGSKSGSGKYKASAEEIEAIKKELPAEYEKLRKIQHEVVNNCRFMFASDSYLSFYVNTLPSLLNLNGEEWIAGWARETGKNGCRWAPILVMYNNSFVLCYDFDNKFWFFIINGKEYTPKKNIWDSLLPEFERSKKIAKDSLALEYPDIYRQVITYLDLNIKLIKKYGKL